MTQDPFKDGREEARRVGTDIGFDIGKVVHVPDDAGHRVVIETITDTGETASGQEAAIVVADTRGDISLPEEGDTVAVARFKDRRPIVLGFIYTAETNVPGYTDGDRKLDGDPLILSGSSVDLETNLDASGYQLQTVNILDFEDRSGTGKHYELTNLSGELKFNVFDSSNNFQRTALKMKEGGNVVKDDGTNLVVRGGSDIEMWPGEVSLITLKGTGVSIFGDTSANYGSLRDHGSGAADCLRWYNSTQEVEVPNGTFTVSTPDTEEFGITVDRTGASSKGIAWRIDNWNAGDHYFLSGHSAAGNQNAQIGFWDASSSTANFMMRWDWPDSEIFIWKNISLKMENLGGSSDTRNPGFSTSLNSGVTEIQATDGAGNTTTLT